ncbi:MAG: shikimate dehydrogenase family protein [Solirubrobacteraceae bacterium]
MTIVSRTRLGVLGWPVAHSRSPAIHNAALAAAGLEGWRYQLLPAPLPLLGELVRALPGAGFAGANVTIPHKRAALSLATGASDRARAIGAANTLVFGRGGSGEIDADNTDAPAIIAALPLDPRGRTALVLGAGGSARAAVWALLDAGATSVAVWNRTADGARRLATELGARAVSRVGAADVLVNCTAVGLLGGELPVDGELLADCGCVVDLVYAERETALVACARALGIPVVDGLEILVGQGSLSFERFTGVAASRQAMRAAAGAAAGGNLAPNGATA